MGEDEWHTIKSYHLICWKKKKKKRSKIFDYTGRLVQWKLEKESAVLQLFHRGGGQYRANLPWHLQPWIAPSVRRLLNPLYKGSAQLWGAEIILSPSLTPHYREATAENFRCHDSDRSTGQHQATLTLPHLLGSRTQCTGSQNLLKDQCTVLESGSSRSL